MSSIQKPHKSFEIEYCRKIPTPVECQIVLSQSARNNIPTSLLETRQSSLGKNAGRGVFAKTNIPKGSMIGYEKSSSLVYFEPDVMGIIYGHFEILGKGSGSYAAYAYMYGYGFDSQFYSLDEGSVESYYVDGSMMTFVNHGCNSTSNIVDLCEEYFCDDPPCLDLDEQSLSEDDAAKYLDYIKPCSSPIVLRHVQIFGSLDVASRDILAGEEIFQNYLTYEKLHNELLKSASVLKNICSGAEIGEVTKYESGKSMYETK